MRAADVGFIIHKGNWISRTIAWFMGSRWSHCFLVLEQTENRTYTVETSDFEVTIGLKEIYDEKPDVEMEIYRNVKLTEQEIDLIAKRGLERYGENYGYFQLFSLGVRRLFMKLRLPQISNFIRSGIVCCGVVVHALNRAPKSGFFGMHEDSIDTEEVYQYIRNNSDWVLIYKN